MKSLSALCIALLSVLLLIGCSDDPVPSNGTIQQLFPLAIGNSWKVQVVEYDDLGNVEAIDTMSLTIDSAGTSFGHSGFFASSQKPIFLYYNNGVDLLSQNPNNKTDYKMVLRYPMAVNEIVITEDTTYPNGYRSQSLFKMISENTPVSVPAGTFNCVVYMDYNLYGKGTLDTTSIDIQSFAFGTGYVKLDTYYRNSSTSKTVLKYSASVIKATIK
jgi:hypothetical protein